MASEHDGSKGTASDQERSKATRIARGANMGEKKNAKAKKPQRVARCSPDGKV